MTEFEFFENVTTRRFYRWYELLDLFNKKDGRRFITFEDKGYVEDIDSFLTGCISGFPLVFMIDSSKLGWTLISDVKKFKTILDFNNGKITCQGLYYGDLIGYQRSRLNDMEIESFCILPCTNIEKENAIKYLKQ